MLSRDSVQEAVQGPHETHGPQTHRQTVQEDCCKLVRVGEGGR